MACWFLPRAGSIFDPETIPYFNSYYKWDGKEGLTFSTQLYNDPLDRFTINFAPEWQERVTVDTKSVQNKSLKFIMTDTGETVAEVSFFSPAEWDNVKNTGWKLLGRDLDKNDRVPGRPRTEYNWRRGRTNQILY
ncbi:hypothetical protein ACFTAO_25280 [Paenibacillus rhizoplanae]